MKRRSFLKTSSVALRATGGVRPVRAAQTSNPGIQPSIALNAYSFNNPLREGTMSLEELFRFSAQAGFRGVDLTAYYIQGYPEVPTDNVLFDIKKMAFQLGIGISGTGVKNDFTLEDQGELEKNKILVKNWIIAASKLGAPHVRIFDGKGSDTKKGREEVKRQVIESFRECADFGAQHGVMVLFQNHNDYIKKTPEITEVMESIKSDWFGLMLDTGSVTGGDPYGDIEKLIPYASSWQVKEQVISGQGKADADISRLMLIVKQSGYTGYFPIETLGEGDAKMKVSSLYKKIMEEM